MRNAINAIIKTNCIFIFISLTCSVTLYSQSSCTNSDFETGTLNGWQGQTGSCCPIFTTPSGIVSGRHTIMSGTGTDPNACNNITVVAPGGLYSARVGNDDVNGQAETLSYTITVSPSSSLFIYKYAVVLQDPGHNPSEQPRFQVRVLNALGQLIDPTCGKYTVVAGAGLSGFQTCPNGGGDVRYRDWTTVGLNLSAYLGQTLTIEFETGDCSLGAHFGYAYVDAYCSPLTIGATFCSSSFAAELTAPIGFSYLWNTGETTQTILVNSPAAGLNYSCTLTSVTGCTVVISTVLQLENPTASFTMTNTCFNNAVFQDTTILSNASLLDSYLWDFGDGTTANVQNPTHSFPGTGSYLVKFTTFNAFGCTTTSTQTVTVFSAPTAQITYGQTNFCTSDITPKVIQLTGTDAYTGGTYSVDVAGLSFNAVTGEFTPSISIPGTYIVSYTIPTANGCTVAPVSTTVMIIQSPQANIAYGAPSYCNQINWQQSVALTGLGIITGGTYSASPAGLSIDPSSGGIIPSLSAGGNYVVTYDVPPSGGVCSGISATANVTIVNAPTAQLVYASPFCISLTTPQTVTLTGTGSFGGGFYGSFPSGLQINASSGTITPSLSNSGDYTVTYTIPAAGGCSSVTVNKNVSITPVPTASIDYLDPFCKSIFSPEPVIISGTAAYTGGIFTAPAGVTIDSTNGGITPSTTVAGSHQIVYTIPASLGCAAVPVSTSVVILPLPEPTLSNFSICQDPRGFVFRPALLDTGLSDLQYSCQWYLNGVLIPGVATNQYTAAVEGNYTVLVTNLVTGCVAPLATSLVSTAVTVEDFVTYITNTFEDDNTLTVLVNGGTGPYLYQVDGLPFQVSNVFSGLTSGIHEVTITDVNYCTDVTKRVMVLGYPNYFTPNGDGFNDLWNIFYYDPQPNARIYIYDRYGKMLKQLSPQSPGWDGTFNGTPLPSSDYWFLVEYKDYNEKGELEWGTFKSHFSLKR